MSRYKVMFLISHPVQYFSPLFKELAKQPEIDLAVFYCSDKSVRGMKDPGFKKEIKWDLPLLEGYNYKFLKNYSPMPSIFKPPFGLMNFAIISGLRRNKYDAIIIHGWHYFTHWLVFLAAPRRTRIFLHTESPLNQELLKAKWKLLVKKMILGFLFRKVPGFLAIGTENKEFYKYYGVKDEKIFFTPYAVDNDRLTESYEKLKSKKEEIKKELGIPLEKAVILFCGKLIKKKRPMDLLLAFDKINSENKALVFLGDGGLRQDLEKYARDRNLKSVYFTGFKNQTEMPKYYIASDVLVLPSGMGETWGLVVNEAMCFHLPVIVSDLTGCGKDLVKHGENGFIFKAGDIEGLAHYITGLLQDFQLRSRMSKRSFEIIRNYCYEADCNAILEAIKFAIKEKAPCR